MTFSPETMRVEECAKLIGIQPGSLRGFMRDHPGVKVKAGVVSLPALEKVLAQKAARDIRSLTPLRALRACKVSSIAVEHAANAGRDTESTGHLPVMAGGLDAIAQISDIRLRREQAALSKAEMQNASLAGDLVRKSDAQAVLARLAINSRQRFETLGDRIAHTLIGASQREISLRINAEIEAILREIAESERQLNEAFR